MTALLFILGWGAALIVAIPTIILCVEICASFVPVRKRTFAGSPQSLAVIVPAHNESIHIKETLEDLKLAADDGTQILVVADNCDDDTAAVASSLGVNVVERHDPSQRGKGYALQFAIDHLRQDPPECVAFFDADCRLPRGALREIAGLALETGRPVQSLYEMAAPSVETPKTSISQFAWILINQVRMCGLHNLAGVTRFTGVGLAAPWRVISTLDFGGGAITEDHELTFELAERRCAPLFHPHIRVVSQFPDQEQATVTQRSRWEHGSLNVMRRRALPGVMKGVATMNPQLLAISMDALVPPIVIFALLITVSLAGTAMIALAGVVPPFFFVVIAGFLFAVSIAAAWAGFGRSALPPRALAGAFPYLLEKLKIYGGEGRQSSKSWTRTGRSDDE